MKGIMRVAPVTAVLFAGGALALGGMPPFNVFVSEFMLVTAGIQAGKVAVTVVCLLLLTIVLAGLVRMVASTVLGPSPEALAKGELGSMTLLPIALLMVLMLVMGLHIPQPVLQLLHNAAAIVMDNGSVPASDMLTLPWQSVQTTIVHGQ